MVPVHDVEALSFVRRVARRMSPVTGLSIDDLASAGLLALLEAARRYDPTRSSSFGGYVAVRVRGAMVDEARAWDQRPRRAPGASASRIDVVWEDGLAGGIDGLPHHDDDAEQRLVDGQRRAALGRALTQLPAREGAVLQWHYVDGLTLREIGARFGVSESRASQLHRGAIERLRRAVA